MPSPYLQVDHLTKSFGEHVLFEDISFGVAQGQRIGLIAKNGTGKSTLLDILAGVEGYDSGSIVYRSGLSIGYLPQTPTFAPAGVGGVVTAGSSSSERAASRRACRASGEIVGRFSNEPCWRE